MLKATSPLPPWASRARKLHPANHRSLSNHDELGGGINRRARQIASTKFIYTGIHVSDLDRSIKFYTKELKMKLLFRAKIKETGGEVAWLKSTGSSQVLELN